MAEYTQTQINELGKIAETHANSSLPKEVHFIGIEGGRAVFGIRFIAPGKLGFPVFVKVSKSGLAEKVTEREEKLRLMSILERVSQ